MPAQDTAILAALAAYTTWTDIWSRHHDGDDAYTLEIADCLARPPRVLAAYEAQGYFVWAFEVYTDGEPVVLAAWFDGPSLQALTVQVDLNISLIVNQEELTDLPA